RSRGHPSLLTYHWPPRHLDWTGGLAGPAMKPDFDHCSTIHPGRADVRLAAEALPRLAALLDGCHAAGALRLRPADGGPELLLPVAAARMLETLLREVSRWNSLALVAIGAELTTQRAAELLNVSRPVVARLMDRGEIPCRRVGR